MRSSKTRSRNKPSRNRPNTVGNVVNRVFDSSGPEGKVRGTPQQIIEKYNQLARDAQLSNDRVATENFQQHAEHYLRMLGEAQKEMDAKREQQERENRERQERENRDRQAERDRDRTHHGGGDPANASQPDAETLRDTDHDRSGDKGREDSAGRTPGAGRETTVRDDGDDDNRGSTLVDTPEGKPKRAPRKPRRASPQDKGQESGQQGAEDGADDTPPARKAHAPRTRKPKDDATKSEASTTSDDTPSDTAAE
ncbi:MAG TPA: DUF4167 domain-containing protein [Roseovarius sp.]